MASATDRSSPTRRSLPGPAASATRARTTVRGAGGVQPPAERRRCSRTRPRTLRSGRSWPASAPEPHVHERRRGRPRRPPRRAGAAARRSRFARRTPRKAPRKAGSKASVSSRAKAAGSLAQRSPSVSASSSARAGLPSASQRRAKTGVGRARRALPRRTARSASVSAAGPSHGVATSACERADRPRAAPAAAAAPRPRGRATGGGGARRRPASAPRPRRGGGG